MDCGPTAFRHPPVAPIDMASEGQPRVLVAFDPVVEIRWKGSTPRPCRNPHLHVGRLALGVVVLLDEGVNDVDVAVGLDVSEHIFCMWRTRRLLGISPRSGGALTEVAALNTARRAIVRPARRTGFF